MCANTMANGCETTRRWDGWLVDVKLKIAGEKWNEIEFVCLNERIDTIESSLVFECTWIKKTSYVKINKKCTIDARPMHKKLQHLFSRWNKFKRITLCFGTIQKKRASVSMYSFHHEFVDALKNWRWSLITFTQNAEREKKVVNSPIRKL